MFPQLKVAISGLNPRSLYAILCDIVRCDDRRYKYMGQSRGWVGAGRADAEPTSPRLYVHPESPAAGEVWMKKQYISFHKIKLTNNLSDKNGFVLSFERYSIAFT